MGNCFIIDFENFYLYKIIEDSFFFNYLLNNCTLSLDDLLSKSIDLFEKKLKVIILVIIFHVEISLSILNYFTILSIGFSTSGLRVENVKIT